VIAGIVGFDPADGMVIPLSCVLYVFRGLCDGLITHSEESYQVCVCVCLIVYGPEASERGSLGPVLVVAPQKKNPAVKTSTIRSGILKFPGLYLKL
jgi:hypothetical protein